MEVEQLVERFEKILASLRERTKLEGAELVQAACAVLQEADAYERQKLARERVARR